MDISKQEKLIADLGQIGINEYSARSAIRNCERAMLAKGTIWAFGAGIAGAGFGLAGGRPDVGGLVGLVSGAAVGMNRAIDSDSCGPADWNAGAQQKLRSEVRKFLVGINNVKDLINP